jgi:uncharacterized membrane protein
MSIPDSKQGAVRSSALLTLIVSGFLYFFPQLLSTYLTQYIPAVFIGASFYRVWYPKTQLSTYFGLSLAGVIFTTILLKYQQVF